MGIKKISIEEFLSLGIHIPVMDVRSPGEYAHAHIPAAYNLPIFSDEERKIIGTAYKQENREKAIKLGLDFFGIKMRSMVEGAENIIKDRSTGKGKATATTTSLAVHCWRGGMRSAAVAWLLSLYGFEIYLLEGGYKNYRNWVLQQFEKEYKFHIIGGYTGSAKTELLHEMDKQQQAVIDLEGLANHKGSAFGALGQPPQPSQEMFENIFANRLHTKNAMLFWLEDESQRIGNLNIPPAFWQQMRAAPVYFLDVPFEKRLQHIIAGYGKCTREQLVNAIMRIQKRLGPLETKTAISFLLENDVEGCFRILLQYYDKNYLKSLNNRENLSTLLNKIDCEGVEAVHNSEKLRLCMHVAI